MEYMYMCVKDSIQIFPICHFKIGTIFNALYLILISFSLTLQKSTVAAGRFQSHKILRKWCFLTFVIAKGLEL